tara:strand:+ start:10626 stop:11390 length:765 start_codon:yes stop_codon:yes gene_type:complete
MGNLTLWDSFGKTDPKYTKAANVDGNKQTSLSGNYMVKLATSSLGPIGEYWGYRIIEERFDNTKPIMIKGSDNKLEILKDGDSIVWEQNHTLLVEFWHGDRGNTFVQFGHTKYRYMKTDGSKMVIDNEYAKKSLTDAMKKCLSLIGVCADVFMGEFDDHGYQQAAKLENDLKNADDKDAEYVSKTQQFNNYIEDKIKTMEQCPNFNAMQSVYGMAVQKIDREAPILGINAAEAKVGLDEMYHKMNAGFSGEVSK